jgi:hypothetical protein
MSTTHVVCKDRKYIGVVECFDVDVDLILSDFMTQKRMFP